jgi:hypothetical protein
MHPLLRSRARVLGTGDISAPVTEEHRKLALVDTERDLVTLRDMLRKLDLPATNLELAHAIFLQHAVGNVTQEIEAKAKARDVKIRELMRATRPTHLGAFGDVSSLTPPPPGLFAFPDYEEMTDEELDAELARIRSLKG